MNLTTILIIVNVFAALSIIVLALMQTSKGDMGSAFGGGGSQGMFGARGSANFLSRSTSLMCAVFFISSLSLAYIYAKRADTNSVVETSVFEEASEVPTVDTGLPVVDESSTVPSLETDQVEGEIDSVIEEIPSENQ
jgi:preprotein translocase subunit SecG